MTSVRRILTTLCALVLTVFANAQSGTGNPSLIDFVRHQVDYKDNLSGAIHRNPVYNWALPWYWQTPAFSPVGSAYGLCKSPLPSTYAPAPIYTEWQYATIE